MGKRYLLDTNIVIYYLEGVLTLPGKSPTTVLDLDGYVADQAIQLRKLRKIKTPDAIIAATCLCYNLKLITRNTADFSFIKELTITNPFEL
jgi:hypothetical protein